ncbi:MAG: TSUP family transporter [Rubrivivax sp.]
MRPLRPLRTSQPSPARTATSASSALNARGGGVRLVRRARHRGRRSHRRSNARLAAGTRGGTGGGAPGHRLRAARAVRRGTQASAAGASPAGLPLLGLVVGALSAWSGTGGPVVLLPLLALLGWPPLQAVDAAQRVQLPVAAAATAVNLAARRLDLLLGAAIGVVVVAGWAAGRFIAARLPVRRLRQAVAVALVATGVAWRSLARELQRMPIHFDNVDDDDSLRGALRASELLLACEQTLLPQGATRGIGVLVRNGRFAAVGPLDEVARRRRACRCWRCRKRC